MKNKVLVQINVPELNESYNVYLPINRKIGNVINLLSKSIFELTNGMFQNDGKILLYSERTGEKYPINSLIRETDIRNGSTIIFM